MSTPVIWVVFPVLLGLVLLISRKYEPATHFFAIFGVLLLAYLAWVLPFEESITLIPLPSIPSITISTSLTVLGRSFILDNISRPAIILIYLGTAFWFGGAYTARAGQLFVPLGLWIAALLTSSLAVEPFLYAAIMILGVALLCVPILNPPGTPVNRGVIRFLTFQTMGMPFILIGGQLLSNVEINPTDVDFALRVTLIIGLGFAFITAVFPFHTWIPMVAERSHPYASAFVFFLFPAIVSLLSVSYIQGYRTVGIPVRAGEIFRYIGLIMILIGGVLAALERSLTRILGYAAIYEIGMSLLAISLVVESQFITPSAGLYFAQQAPRALGLAVWAMALCFLIDNTNSLHLDAVKGFGRKFPVISTSIVLSTFSIAGLPVLAGFPASIAIWSNIFRISPVFVLLGLIGTIGLMAAAVRTLVTFSQYDDHTDTWRINESIPQILFLGSGWILLFLIGILPQLIYPVLTNMAIIHNIPAR